MSCVRDRLIQLKQELENAGNEAYFSKANIQNIVELLLTDLELDEKKNGWISVDDRLPEEIDRRHYMCLLENHVEDMPMFCQYSELYGFGFYRDIYDPVTLGFLDSEFDTMEELDYEKVLYWRELLDPPEEDDYETD